MANSETTTKPIFVDARLQEKFKVKVSVLSYESGITLYMKDVIEDFILSWLENPKLPQPQDKADQGKEL